MSVSQTPCWQPSEPSKPCAVHTYTAQRHMLLVGDNKPPHKINTGSQSVSGQNVGELLKMLGTYLKVIIVNNSAA